MDYPIFLFLAVLLAFSFFGIMGAFFAGKGQRGPGFLVGLLLGPIGVIGAILLGNRAVLQRIADEVRLASSRAAAPAQKQPSPQSALADAPAQLTVRRDGEIIGTWPLADALDYLASGHLLPTDHYLQNEETNTWRLLSRLSS